jgi:drug/metabolite transporter (DMT)-like permease
MALGPQVIGHGSFNYAVRYIPVTILGLISLTEPIGASILAFVLFGERPSPASILGIVVTLVAVAGAIWLTGKRSRPEEASSVRAST